MSIVNRLKRLEGELPNTDGPLSTFVTTYEAKEPEYDDHKKAFVLWADGSSEAIEMRDDEASDEFEARLAEIQTPKKIEPMNGNRNAL